LETLLRYQNALSRPSVPLLTRIGARIEIDHNRLPVAVAGKDSVVFRLTGDDGAKIALRLPQQENGAGEWPVRYAALDAYDAGPLRRRLAPGYKVHRNAVSVAAAEGDEIERLTALVSNWIEGPTLLAAADRAARAGNVQILRALAMAVRDVANAMRQAGFVHGDLTASNLVVNKEGQLVLVDLDTASWPGSPLGTTGSGSPGYRHPTGAASTRLRDGFPILVMYASLMALAENPDRRRSWGDPVSTPDGVLLFTDWDLGAPDTSESIRDVRRVSGREVARLLGAVQRVLDDGPESIERHLKVIPGLAPLAVIDPVPESTGNTWDLGAAVRRMRSRFDADPPRPQAPAEDLPVDEFATWATPTVVEPIDEPGKDVAELRAELKRAIAGGREADVARLWLALGHDPVARTMGLEVEAVYAASLSARIERETRQGRDAMVVAIAAEAKQRHIPLPPEARAMVRRAKDRIEVRNRLDYALEADSRDDLAELAVSGQLVVLGDTDRRSLVRVLQALEWPLLQRALETDDDRMIVSAYDQELFEEAESLPPHVTARVTLARERLKWADRMRAALHQRLASEVVALHDSAPERAEAHLSAAERKRIHRLVEQQRALRNLAQAIQSNDEGEIVAALAIVERVGARLGEHFPWHAIRDVLERVSLIEDLIEAARATPIDHVRLAQLIPAARAIGLENDSRLSGDLALDVLQTKVIHAAHVRRVRLAIQRGDDRHIVWAALPDVYNVLDELTEPERDRIAQAIRSQRRQDRHAVAARFSE
jgi:hypothetical protein